MPDEEDRKPQTGKCRLDLLPFEALGPIANVFEHGLEKYGLDNWRQLSTRRLYFAAIMRHLLAWMMREEKDPDSGLSHLAHAGACILILITAEDIGLGKDDRPGG